MFSINHFIWLAIVLVTIIGLLVLQKIKKIKYNTIITYMFIVSIISELI